MELPDNKPKKSDKPWFWDLLHRTDVQKPEPLREISFRTPNLTDDKLDQEWLRLKQAISQVPEADQPPFTRYPVVYRIAAVVALLLLAGGGIWAYLASSMHTYMTHYGETARVKLPDGSMVTLNANSKLTYQNWDNEKDREVWLEGEAFFEVQKKKRPGGKVKFIVHTNDLLVEVLGTRFNVSDRGSRTQVVLEEGNIRLHLASQASQVIDMHPGQMLEYSDGIPVPVTQVVNPHTFTAWKDNQLILNGKSLGDIARLISENYGVEVVIQDSATAHLKLQGSIPMHNLEELIEALTLAADVKIERVSNQLTIKQP